MDDVQIGPKVNLITENHPVDPSKRKHLDLKSILIKRNAWIGTAATILPGVTIEKTRSLPLEQWLIKMFLRIVLWVVFQPS
jgi:hypothetical protein